MRALFHVLSLLAFAGLTYAAASAEPQPQPAATPFVWVDATASTSHLSNGSPEWHDTQITLGTRKGRTASYASVLTSNHFGRSDSGYLAGAYITPSVNTELSLELTFSPTHQVMPYTQTSISFDHRLANGWGYAVGYGNRVFPGLSVATASLGTDRYWRSLRAAYTVSLTTLSNVSGTSLSQNALLTHFYGADQRSSVTFTVNAGREAENVGGPVLVSTVTGATLRGTHWLGTSPTALTWSASLTRQGGLYARSEVQLGLRRRL